MDKIRQGLLLLCWSFLSLCANSEELASDEISFPHDIGGKLNFLILYDFDGMKDPLSKIIYRINGDLEGAGGNVSTLALRKPKNLSERRKKYIERVTRHFGSDTKLIILAHGNQCDSGQIAKSVQDDYGLFFPKETLLVSCQAARLYQSDLLDSIKKVSYLDSTSDSYQYIDQKIIGPFPSICFGDNRFGYAKVYGSNLRWKVLERVHTGGEFLLQTDNISTSHQDRLTHHLSGIINKWDESWSGFPPQNFRLDLIPENMYGDCNNTSTIGESNIIQSDLVTSLREPSNYKGSSLNTNGLSTLQPTDYIYDNNMLLILEENGNLVLYRLDGLNATAIWESQTRNGIYNRAVLRENGTLELVYVDNSRPNEVFGQSGGGSVQKASLILEENSGFVIYQDTGSSSVVTYESTGSDNSIYREDNLYNIAESNLIDVTNRVNKPTPEEGQIINWENGECLNITGSSGDRGSNVNLWPCGASNPHQYWVFDSLGRLRNPHTNLCLNVIGNTGQPGSGVNIWTCYTTNSDQRWYFTQNGELRNQQKDVCLDFAGGSARDVRLGECGNDALDNRWSIVEY